MSRREEGISFDCEGVEGDVKVREEGGVLVACVEMKFCSRFSSLNIYLLQTCKNELVSKMIFLQLQPHSVDMRPTATDI
jgi:hypothetical protein